MLTVQKKKDARKLSNRRRRHRHFVGWPSAGCPIDNSRIDHNRWYDPSVGKWLSEDPSGLAAGANPYSYCGDAPTDGIDPSGMAETVKISNGTFLVSLSEKTARSVDVKIIFKADKKLKCPHIRFIQIVKVTDKNGKPIDWSTFAVTMSDNTTRNEGDRNKMITTSGWVVDVLTYQNKMGQHASMFYADYASPGFTMGSDGSAGDAQHAADAVLLDTPGSSKPQFFSWRFESYAVSLPLRTGEDFPGDIPNADAPGFDAMYIGGQGNVLGGVAWGFDLDNPIKFQSPTPLEQPSTNFDDAMKNFKAFYWGTGK